jgi:hypothetical protein
MPRRLQQVDHDPDQQPGGNRRNRRPGRTPAIGTGRIPTTDRRTPPRTRCLCGNGGQLIRGLARLPLVPKIPQVRLELSVLLRKFVTLGKDVLFLLVNPVAVGLQILQPTRQLRRFPMGGREFLARFANAGFGGTVPQVLPQTLDLPLLGREIRLHLFEPGRMSAGCRPGDALLPSFARQPVGVGLQVGQLGLTSLQVLLSLGQRRLHLSQFAFSLLEAFLGGRQIGLQTGYRRSLLGQVPRLFPQVLPFAFDLPSLPAEFFFAGLLARLLIAESLLLVAKGGLFADELAAGVVEQG